MLSYCSPMATTPLALEPLTGIDEVRDEWAALALAAGNLYATPEWGETWLAHVATGLALRLRLFGARDARGELVAVIPLVVVAGRHVRKARFLGFGPANQLGPVAAPPDGDDAVWALRAALTATRGEWDLFLGENLRGSGWAGKLGAATVLQQENPTARGPWPTWDDYLASRSHNFRSDLRRKERRLREQGLVFRAVAEPSRLEEALDVLFRLHRARWGDDASIWFAGQEPFHRAFARTALDRGWLHLWLLELEGEPVAAYLGYRFGGTELVYQYGRDPAPRATSPGLVLIGHAVREAFAAGASAVEFGPGPQAYKFRFATDDPGLETVGLAQGLRGRAALLAARRRA